MSKISFKSHLYNKFLGFLNKKGGKIKAKKILSESFLILSKRTGLSVRLILLKIFLKLNTFVEVKRIRVRKRVTLVPFYIKYNRRLYLVVKWIMMAVKEDTRRIPIINKFSNEVLQLLSNKSSKALKFKENNVSQVLLNRSNMHFRW